MNTRPRIFKSRAYWIALPMIMLLALMGMSLVGGNNASANHPVLVEGNCDSPVPFTTLVAPGTCGDYDGDGRIGTAEDTDGADRIFGTINAAIGPGTGAAAGTGANHNGLVQIVQNGRYPEVIYIGQNTAGPGGPGIADPGNVTLQANPGVTAIIDAVLQGDSAANNNARQAAVGITVTYTATGGTRMVTLRNLAVRNYLEGINVSDNTRIHMDNVRVENSLNNGIRVFDNVFAVITDSQVASTGFRIGSSPIVPTPGAGIAVTQNAKLKLVNSTVTQNIAFGINNTTGLAANLVLYKVGAFFNFGGNINGLSTICTDDAACASN